MASDLSNIIKEDISNTLESLLSLEASISNTRRVINDDFIGQQCINIEIEFNFSKFGTVLWKFFVPTLAATKFEFLMLGGIGDLKDSIDDEIADASNEIISNICGSMVTNINAQSYSDLGTAKFTLINSEIIQCESKNSFDSFFRFDINLSDENVFLFIEFEPSFLPYISMISTGQGTGTTSSNMGGSESGLDFNVSNENPILSLLGEESIENLKLLFDIKFKLSVRLGTKIVLLKDITNWDTGTIIELEQMVNEPLDILANGIKIGIGEAVIVDGKFGIKIKNIGDRKI